MSRYVPPDSYTYDGCGLMSTYAQSSLHAAYQQAELTVSTLRLMPADVSKSCMSIVDSRLPCQSEALQAEFDMIVAYSGTLVVAQMLLTIGVDAEFKKSVARDFINDNPYSVKADPAQKISTIFDVMALGIKRRPETVPLLDSLAAKRFQEFYPALTISDELCTLAINTGIGVTAFRLTESWEKERLWAIYANEQAIAEQNWEELLK
ncbi:hypothetical protein IPO96_04975 [Candidatus Saccharibacteria bacterium]|nr:MAG: hypothetical protein IPO96_04975 [Candidatus Saccharibacteria bacterium]